MSVTSVFSISSVSSVSDVTRYNESEEDQGLLNRELILSKLTIKMNLENDFGYRSNVY